MPKFEKGILIFIGLLIIAMLLVLFAAVQDARAQEPMPTSAPTESPEATDPNWECGDGGIVIFNDEGDAACWWPDTPTPEPTLLEPPLPSSTPSNPYPGPTANPTVDPYPPPSDKKEGKQQVEKTEEVGDVSRSAYSPVEKIIRLFKAIVAVFKYPTNQ